MTPGLLLVVCVLSVYRAARLVAVDAVFDRPRNWLARRAGRVSESLSYLVACPFCVSTHLAGWLVLSLFWFTDVSLPLPLLWWLAVAGGASVLAAFDHRMMADD